jgi:hypothetical protein
MTNDIEKKLENLLSYQTDQTCLDVLLSTLGELVLLRAERDEARREVCVLQVLYANFYSVGEEKECAEDRAWDCFKETP